ncbi:uncharacterized protein DFL_008366 [Arthrobotrys flagrans]|uniref:Uncharacterized protein n=1 Tax=Arthrobotrys flagrans TaxID=97331 RepID=A0A436ZNJ5_ARTFL|nr:hypothetical protein DFL_008366 [Arthrobotrys flagrans]
MQPCSKTQKERINQSLVSSTLPYAARRTTRLTYLEGGKASGLLARLTFELINRRTCHRFHAVHTLYRGINSILLQIPIRYRARRFA